MTDSMLPILRQLHDADGDRARADTLLRMPDSVVLKYHEVIERCCRRAGFEAGWNFVALRVSLALAVRDGAGLPPAELSTTAERFRLGLAEFAAGGSIMTALGKQVDPLTRALTPVVRDLLMAEVERLAASIPAAKPKSASKADDAIMEACRQVAGASDRLAQAKFGAGEIAARKSLERAGSLLGRTMRKYGRMP